MCMIDAPITSQPRRPLFSSGMGSLLPDGSSNAPLLEAETILPVSGEAIGIWPIIDVLCAEVTQSEVIIVRCAKVGSPTKGESKPFKSADPRPRKLTRDKIKVESEAVATALAARINAAVKAAFPPRRLLCIINPKSGGFTGVQLFAKHARPVLEAAGAVLEMRETGAPGDATRWAHEARLEDFDGIAVIGGDGTLNEVIEGLATRPDAAKACAALALGHLGGGSSNAIACNIAMEYAQHHHTPT